jgi:ribosomal protein L17
MRISLIVILISLLCLSCSKTKEKKIQEIVNNSIKNDLFFPDSYDPIEVYIDSVFDNMLSPENVEMAYEIIKIDNEVKSLYDEIVYTKELRDAFSSSPHSSIYKSDTKKIQNLENSRFEKENQLMQLFNSLQEQYWQRREFTGYCAIQKFRAKNNDNQICIGQYAVYIDTEATKSIAYYDLSSKQLVAYNNIIELIQKIGKDNVKQEAWKQIYPHRQAESEN